MLTRVPAVAGRFYPADPAECRRAAERLLSDAVDTPALGGVVPHAGWPYSGATAGLTIRAIAAGKPDTVVLFGAAHYRETRVASVFGSGCWETPLGAVQVDEELASDIVDGAVLFDAPEAHRREHSIEVQLPLLKFVLPAVRIVPINVAQSNLAVQVGRRCAAAARRRGGCVAFMCSTDLTHYGPNYDFEPHGPGRGGIRWAKEVNDRRFIELITKMKADELVAEAQAHQNACGAGAVAALVGAMLELGATEYRELRHTCSAETGAAFDADPQNSVGYEAGIFPRFT